MSDANYLGHLAPVQLSSRKQSRPSTRPQQLSSMLLRCLWQLDDIIPGPRALIIIVVLGAPPASKRVLLNAWELDR